MMTKETKLRKNERFTGKLGAGFCGLTKEQEVPGGVLTGDGKLQDGDAEHG
jgi:hypothetical protein